MDSFETLDPSSKLKNVSDYINNMMDELYQEAGTTLLNAPDSSMAFMDMYRDDENHIRKIKEFQDYFEMVKRMVKPGCSEEVLKVALASMSSLVSILTYMSSPNHRSSL
ncbi:pyrophosphate--fructose 6-phosphate 1-phosphotransferase subunit alpha-like [Hibiscus syriacus]|uniref:pyrophosphate--fructose 6-phosphate 1-phosphotransferase subunit alpha-like n=1 Tax=Hibiscus syriacus TaxID=106335 RepID=UPI001922381F|nr:pyrophosphate--fructose 6-phosphate 1-phosphotransferase subunit alpha-like [Hibiscus syriacus]